LEEFPNKYDEMAKNIKNLKARLKKVAKMFGGIKRSVYLCLGIKEKS